MWDTFCIIGLIGFALLAIWANQQWHRETAGMSPEARKAFKRTANDEMAIW